MGAIGAVDPGGKTRAAAQDRRARGMNAIFYLLRRHRTTHEQPGSGPATRHDDDLRVHPGRVEAPLGAGGK